MDWNRVQGSWKQFTGKVKEKWGKLTDDDLTAINGRRDQLEGKIQERYGIAKDQVRRDVDTWLNQLPVKPGLSERGVGFGRRPLFLEHSERRADLTRSRCG
jgi:uncharacterized protein YjbJ (UPF0337 family)